MRIGTAAETPSDNPGTACVKTGHCVAVMCGTARTAADRCGPPRTRREPVRTRAYRMATGPLGDKQGSVSTQQWCLSGWQVRGRAQCCAMLRNAAQCCAMTGTRRETRANMAAPLSLGGVLKRASGRANKHRTATHTEQLRSNAAGPRARREVPANCSRAGSCRGRYGLRSVGYGKPIALRQLTARGTKVREEPTPP